jgi:hypothetical protein
MLHTHTRYATHASDCNWFDSITHYVYVSDMSWTCLVLVFVTLSCLLFQGIHVPHSMKVVYPVGSPFPLRTVASVAVQAKAYKLHEMGHANAKKLYESKKLTLAAFKLHRYYKPPNGRDYMGVKGYSGLARLKDVYNFDMIEDSMIDAMHTVQGVAKAIHKLIRGDRKPPTFAKKKKGEKEDSDDESEEEEEEEEEEGEERKKELSKTQQEKVIAEFKKWISTEKLRTESELWMTTMRFPSGLHSRSKFTWIHAGNCTHSFHNTFISLHNPANCIVNYSLT